LKGRIAARWQRAFSTPNAQTFYERHGFRFVQENVYPSRLAQAELRCIDMTIAL